MEAIKTWLAGQSSRDDVASVAIFNDSEKLLTEYTCRVCHSVISGWSGPGKSDTKGYVASVTMNHRYGFDAKACRAFFLWAYGPGGPYESLMVPDFDLDFAVEFGIIFVRKKDTPYNYFYNGVIASRFPTEEAWACVEWYRRVKLGVHPGLAYWSIWIPPGKPNPNTNHQAFDWQGVSEDYVKNLCAGKIAHPLKSAFPCNKVWGITGAWADPATPALVDEVWLKLYPDQVEVITFPPICANPWAPKSEQRFIPRPAEIKIKSVKDLVEILLKEQVRLGLQ